MAGARALAPEDRAAVWSPASIGAIAALVFLLGVTATWWMLALWPVEAGASPWLERVRQICFNAREDGLPDASGWLLLVGQPIGMLAALMAVWGDAVRTGLSLLTGSRLGRALLVAGALSMAAGLSAAAARVVDARAALDIVLPGDVVLPDSYPRLERPAPALSLVDQEGRRIDVDTLRGRPALVTFAFGSCESVCPAIVRQTLEVRATLRRRVESGELGADAVPRIVIVSLDPWRDTPGRLAHVARHWELEVDDSVLSGSVEEVERTLDRWNVARQRDETTGDVVHPPLVYILDPAGRIAYAVSGGVAPMLDLLGRLQDVDHARSAGVRGEAG